MKILLKILFISVLPIMALAGEYESVLGFNFNIPEGWQVLSPDQVTDNDEKIAERYLGKEKADNIIQDVKAGKLEYIYEKDPSDDAFISTVTLRLTQGAIASFGKSHNEHCLAIGKKLSDFYKENIELDHCNIKLDETVSYINYSYRAPEKSSVTRQYEFQITPNVGLIMTGNADEAGLQTLENIQNQLFSTITSYYTEYPGLYEKSTSEYKSGNYSNAYEGLAKLADMGDINAEYNLAMMYEQGKGVERDYEKAFHYYSSAAAKGSMAATSSLANMYYHGHGVEKNLLKSARLFKLAAESGLSAAQNSYGAMLLKGTGVERDPEEAMQWFLKAVDQGNVDAANNLARIYELAVDAGNNDAALALAVLYLNGLTGEQEVEKGLNLLKTAGNSGHQPSIDTLINIYSEGKYGIERDPDKVKKWRARID